MAREAVKAGLQRGEAGWPQVWLSTKDTWHCENWKVTWNRAATQAIERRPDFIAAHNYIAAAHVGMGHLEQAVDNWQQLVGLDSADADARQWYERVLDLEPDHRQSGEIRRVIQTLSPAKGDSE